MIQLKSRQPFQRGLLVHLSMTSPSICLDMYAVVEGGLKEERGSTGLLPDSDGELKEVMGPPRGSYLELSFEVDRQARDERLTYYGTPILFSRATAKLAEWNMLVAKVKITDLSGEWALDYEGVARFDFRATPDRPGDLRGILTSCGPITYHLNKPEAP